MSLAKTNGITNVQEEQNIRYGEGEPQIGSYFYIEKGYKDSGNDIYKIVEQTKTQWKCLKMRKNIIGEINKTECWDVYKYTMKFDKKKIEYEEWQNKPTKIDFHRFRKKDIQNGWSRSVLKEETILNEVLNGVYHTKTHDWSN